jgi:capsular exopolysaccharide synthesis family protein
VKPLVLNRKKQISVMRKRHLVTYSQPESLISEQFREIRTNMKFINNNDNKIFLITSPQNGEGKSTMLSNLAVSIAKQKEKILIIDANLREPLLHTIFKIPNEIGLTNVLTGNAAFEKAIYKTEISGLEVLTSGSTSFNPAELLETKRMKELLKSISENYDIVLIDAPSILKSTETRVLANQCDGVVLVLNRGKTEIEKAIESKKILELAQAKIVGAILNEG